ncbi:MAG: ABC transporter permease [Clostridia bacterium]|nr:ABC transporter permease [Candidatus Pelethousia sp.]NCB30073.1 ABC transporter permease [Clostridia bacterium]
MRRRSDLGGTLRFAGEYCLSIGIFILFWQIYVSASNAPAYVLPAPGAVVSELVALFAEGTVWPHLITTTLEVIVGFLIGAVMGMILGYLLVKVEFLKLTFMPYLVFAQTAPKIALVPLFVIWFGIGLVSKVVLIVSMVIFPVMSGMVLGIEAVPRDAGNLIRVLGGTKWQMLTLVELPYSLPALFSSYKIGIVQAVIGAIVAEWMSGKQGLGYILTYASSTYDTTMLIAGIIVTIVVGIFTYELVGQLENKLLYWHESKKQ